MHAFFTGAFALFFFLLLVCSLKADVELQEEIGQANITTAVIPLAEATEMATEVAITELTTNESPEERLRTVILSDDVDQFRELLERNFNSDVNTLTVNNRTLLMEASFFGSQSIVDYLLSNESTLINARSFAGETALHFASLSAHPGIVQSMITATRLRSNGSNVTMAEFVEAQHPASKWTPLFYAAKSSLKGERIGEVARILIEDGQANIEHQDVTGSQPVHAAFMNGQIDVLRVLLETKKELTKVKDGSGKTINHLAAEFNVVNFLTSLPDYFDISALDDKGQNPACSAASRGSLDFAKTMVELSIPIFSGQCVYEVDGLPVSGKPLTVAAQSNNLAYIQLILMQEGNPPSPSAKIRNYIKSDNLKEFQRELLEMFDNNVNYQNRTQWSFLMVASVHGSQLVTDFLLSNETTVLNATNDAGETALHLSAKNGYPGIVESLINSANERGILEEVVEAENFDKKWTPLFYAAGSNVLGVGVAEAAGELIENGLANVETFDSNGFQPVHIAFLNERFDVLNVILRNRSHLLESHCKNCSGKTISHLAAENDIEGFLVEMRQDFDVTSVDDEGQNAVCLAAIKGSLNFGRKMAEMSIPINVGKCVYQDGENRSTVGTPLHVAAYHRQKAYIRFLLDVSEQWQVPGQTSPLHVMAMKKTASETLDEDNTILAMFIRDENVKDLELLDGDGLTPFLVAVRSGNIPFARHLRKRGANPMARDRRGYFAMHLANDTEMIDYLLRLPNNLAGGVDVKSVPGQLTPLHVAILEKKSSSVVAFLLNNRADKLAVNDQNQSIAHLAVQENYLTALASFLGKEAFPASIRDQNGLTPLLLAVTLGRVEAVKMMLSNTNHYSLNRLRSSEEAMPLTGETLIHVAITFYNPEILKLLPSLQPNIANMAISDSEGETPLHEIVIDEKLEVFEALLEQISPSQLASIIPIQDIRQRTVIHLLAMRCSNFSIQIAHRLRETFNSTLENLTDVFGETPLEIAIKRNCFEIVRLLLPSFNCSQLNRLGYTPLHVAKRLGFEKLVQEMLSAGTNCSLDQVDSCGIPVREMRDSPQTDRCDPVPLIENGSLNLPSESWPQCIGSKLEISCNPAYVLRGSSVVECNALGKWQVKGFCDSGCGHVTPWSEGKPLDNGTVFRVGSETALTCRAAFITPNTSETAICGTDGQWQLKTQCLNLTVIAELQRELLKAAASANVEQVRQFLQLGFLDVNFRDERDYKGCPNSFPVKNGTALLHVTACNTAQEVTEVVQLLLNNSADVNARESEKGRTPLMYATWRGNLETVRLLLGKGADVNASNVAEETPLFYAATLGHWEIAQLLLAHGADVNAQNNVRETALSKAALTNKYESARVLLEWGASVNSLDNKGGSPLINAASRGRLELSRLLLDKSADVNLTNKQGNTALTIAARNNYPEIVRLLVSRYADVNSANLEGDSALIQAARFCNIDVVKVLVDGGANIDAQNLAGNSALHYAARICSYELAKLLLDRGANVSAANTTGETVLHEAAKNGVFEFVRLFLERGADINKRNQDGYTALMFAAQNMRTEIVRYLLNKPGALRTGCTANLSHLCEL